MSIIQGINQDLTPPSTFDVRMYGAKGDGKTDDSAALQAACNAALASLATVTLRTGSYLCTKDLILPVGTPCVDLVGDGWNCTKLIFSGVSVVNGLCLIGPTSTYAYAGTVKNLLIQCINGAASAITCNWLCSPRLERIQVRGASGIGINLNNTLMARIEQCLLVGNGSSSKGQIEVDNSTTFYCNQIYISGPTTTQAGLKIDRTQGVQIVGGAIESTGIPIMIASKPEAANGCTSGVILCIDLENPNDHFIEFGYGWTGTLGQAVRGWNISNCQGWPSGAAQVSYAAKLKNTEGMTFDNNTWVQNGSPICTYQLEGSSNIGTVIRTHRACNGNAYPFVMVNGIASIASPLTDWIQGN
jgi:Pectate lyase superfamily protein